jgi:glycosyltransferase involved in cell wall biosynthesis
MGPPLSRAQRREAIRTPNLVVHESRFALEWMDDPWADVERAGRWLLDLEQRLAPAAVHLNGYVHGALPWRASVLIVAHSCLLSWWTAVRRELPPAKWDEYRRRVRDGLLAADILVAPTEAMAVAVARHYGPLPRARVVPNGRDGASLRGPARKERIILCAGRVWDEATNVAAVEAVAPRVGWPVAIAGPGSDSRSGSSAVRRLGCLDALDLARWFRRAAIYVLPARYEPFGLSVLEAALARCALVLGDVASLRENWDGAALFVDPEDRGRLERALRALVRDAELRERLAAAAERRARRFAPDRMATAYAAMYGELAAGARERAS